MKLLKYEKEILKAYMDMPQASFLGFFNKKYDFEIIDTYIEDILKEKSKLSCRLYRLSDMLDNKEKEQVLSSNNYYDHIYYGMLITVYSIIYKYYDLEGNLKKDITKYSDYDIKDSL